MAGESTLKRPEPVPVATGTGSSSPASRLRGPRIGLLLQLVAPYVILTLVLVLAVTYIVTGLVTSSARLGFNSQLQAMLDGASDGLTRVENSQLDSLRLLVFTQGLPEAMASGDVDAVVNLVKPLALNARAPIVTLVDVAGRELATLTLTADETDYVRTGGADLSQVEIVRRVLNGDQDAIGDKFADVLTVQGRRYLFTSAPLVGADGQHVGAIMLGQSFDQVLLELDRVARTDGLVALDRTGAVMAAALPVDVTDTSLLQLTSGEVESILASQTALADRDVELAGVPYRFLFAPLYVRSVPVGVFGAGLSTAGLQQQVDQIRYTLLGLLALGTFTVMAIGYILARAIIRPVGKLRDMAEAVAEGDLTQRLSLTRNDEIAELAQTFSEMTERLAERTHEAQRLHAETSERARQLEQTNARLREAQQQLVQSEKLASIGQLTAGIVHDVKNPLAVIKGIAELLQLEDPALSAFAREQIGLIRDNAARANSIVSDLLTFARQSMPKWQLQDLRETVQAAVRLTEYLMRQAGVQVETDLPADPVRTVYDSRQIEQVLINLIQNAVQAMPNGGTLRISLTVKGDQALLQVADSGVGIGPESIGRVFDPFYTTKAEGEGTGLGLSVTYGIISQHGGEIWASSERDRGTTFSIRLPISDHAPEQRS